MVPPAMIEVQGFLAQSDENDPGGYSLLTGDDQDQPRQVIGACLSRGKAG